MKKYITYSLLFLGFLVSCNKKTEVKNDFIARVYDKYLYKEDVTKALPDNIRGKDSILLAKNYINNWVQQQLLFKKAEINLEGELTEIDELVNKYKNDLLVNKYKEAAVKQYLDTIVTNTHIDEFYKENREIFKLNEELVQLKYIHFSNDVLNPKEFKKLFISSKQKDIDSLKAREMELMSFSLNDSIWIRLSDFRRKVPSLNEQDIKQILKNTKFLEKKDSLGVYLVTVKEVLKRNQTSPKSYVIPTIKQMILHKRKLDLIKKIEETLVEDAIKNKEFEIYETK